ncbi:MAG TPA: hypothetical protein P5545_03195 [Bacteroidota bacterium]|nr:hypothetical protein [Bacteroidota bacterium]HRT67243.1 hypothetical protein [Bacteroidota bacterium]
MSKSTSALLWVVAFILMAALAYYQRITGPTYPVSGKVKISGQEIEYHLPRSADIGKTKFIQIHVPDENIIGYIKFKRYKSNDEWIIRQMERDRSLISASLPTQPRAGKIIYEVYLINLNGDNAKLTENPVVLRFKGSVPLYILLPHIVCMFLAMAFGMRAGLGSLYKNDTHLYSISLWTLILFAIGGILLGPIVQYNAFGAFWTGWPFGNDMTDNKTLLSLIMWLIAVLQIRKHPERRGWVTAATVVMLAVYLIPHSLFGSEIDYTKMPK